VKGALAAAASGAGILALLLMPRPAAACSCGTGEARMLSPGPGGADLAALPLLIMGRDDAAFHIEDAAGRTIPLRRMLTLPNLGLENRLPVWLTVLVLFRDVGIVLTVIIANLAIGRLTFKPSIYGKVATATYIITAVIAMLFNYLGYHSVLVDVAIWVSLAITIVSALHYIWHAQRIIEAAAAK